ncbi:GT2D2 protein, partial [Polyodon spathula]|nr:GT2D2 protein [Polyodon spathula]
LKKQQKVLQIASLFAECLTEASFEIVWILAHHRKAFTDTEIVKEYFVASVDILYSDFIRGLELSDICDVTQLCVWARFPKDECFCDELLGLITLKMQTRGEDSTNVLQCCFDQTGLSWKKPVSVCTDISHLLSVIRNFLESKGKEEKELDDPDWLIKLACLTDITSSLSVLNLQGKQKMPIDMLRVITTFQSKIRTRFVPDLQSATFLHFPKLKSLTSDNTGQLNHYRADFFKLILDELQKVFQFRFEDIVGLKEVFCFFENPFPASVSSVSPALTDPEADQAAVENEIVEIQSDTF